MRIPEHGSPVAAAILATLAMFWFPGHGCTSPSPRPAGKVAESSSTAAFVDEQQCAGCHVAQAAAWRGSHHSLAMQPATPATVLGDFNDRTFSGSGSSARFTRDAHGRFLVRTQGPDGLTADFPVRYAFGVAPLQQYLLALPRGRLQALSIAWDVEAQKWFHLYPREVIGPNDFLHWTQPAQNWNFMCAECHSTDVRKNYNPALDAYATTWSQINVGCQACHGPASRHVQWATHAHGGPPVDAAHAGLAVDLGAADSATQIDACARCHSRRSVIAPTYEYGKRLLDFYRPVLLEEALYRPDGQQQDEVYEYGSFLQSKMARKGLRCSDCHDPHSARLKSAGNALCVTCHNAAGAALRPGIDGSGLQRKLYDSPEHFFHKAGQPGSRCIECHAPARSYMVVDARIDHSFRIPRPDLTLRIGTPNACNGCHAQRSPQWALAAIRRHHPDFATGPHYGDVLAAGRDASAGAVIRLRDLIGSDRYAPIVRASALRLLQRYPGAYSSELAAAVLHDGDALVRTEAVSGFEDFTIDERRRWLSPLLQDPVRAVRIEAARLLAPLAMQPIPGLTGALGELEAGYTANFDRPEARAGLAELRMAEGRREEAGNLYREALRLWPESQETAINLAELLRLQGREREAEALLRRTLQQHAGDPVVLQALAYSLIRQQRRIEASALLERGARNGRDAALSYLYGLALIDGGQPQRGVRVLEAALAHAPGDRNLLLALASQAQDSGAPQQAQRYLQRLAAINPDDPALPPGQ